MSEAHYRSFHYTQVYDYDGRRYRAECECGWKGERHKESPDAYAEAHRHLVGVYISNEGIRDEGEDTEPIEIGGTMFVVKGRSYDPDESEVVDVESHPTREAAEAALAHTREVEQDFHEDTRWSYWVEEVQDDQVG